MHPVLARVYAGRNIRTAAELNYGLDGLIPPAIAEGRGRRRGAPRGRDRAAEEVCSSSPTTTRTAPPRARWACARCARSAPRSITSCPIASSSATGSRPSWSTSLAQAQTRSAHHRRQRHRQRRGRGARAQPRHRHADHRPSPARARASGRGLHRQSEPAGLRVPFQGARRRRGDVLRDARVARGVAHEESFRRTEKNPTWPRSPTSSPSAPSPTWCRSTRTTATWWRRAEAPARRALHARDRGAAARRRPAARRGVELRPRVRRRPAPQRRRAARRHEPRHRMPDHRRRGARGELRPGARPAQPRAAQHRSGDVAAGIAKR